MGFFFFNFQFKFPLKISLASTKNLQKNPSVTLESQDLFLLTDNQKHFIDLLLFAFKKKHLEGNTDFSFFIEIFIDMAEEGDNHQGNTKIYGNENNNDLFTSHTDIKETKS